MIKCHILRSFCDQVIRETINWLKNVLETGKMGKKIFLSDLLYVIVFETLQYDKA